MEQEYFLKKTQKAAFIGSYEADFTKDCWTSSEVLDEIFGIDKDYVRSVAGWAGLIHPDDVAMMLTHLNDEVIGKHQQFNKEYRIIRKNDGQTRWVLGLGEVEIDANDNVFGLFGTIQDITERKEVEEQNKIEHQNFVTLFKSNPDPVVLIRAADGVIVDVNEQFELTSGYSGSELIGRTSADLTAYKNPQDREDATKELKEKGSFHNKEVVFITKSGKEIDCILSARTIVLNNVMHFITSIRDMSAVKELEKKLQDSEELFRHSFEFAASGIFIIGLDKKVIMVNDAAQQLLGYSLDDFANFTFNDFTHPEDIEIGESAYRKLISGEINQAKFDKRYIRKNGSIVYVNISISIMKVENKIVKFISQLTDITERKQQEIQLQLSKDVLDIINQQGTKNQSIKEIMQLIKQTYMFDSIGIRLHKNGDYPFFVHDGFSNEFITKENSLTSKNTEVGLCLDNLGKICLECTCGLVISGKADPNNPLFTTFGSFWTNNSLSILDSSRNAEPMVNPRNRCIYAGFRSMAIIPLRSENTVIGLLQFNYKKPNHFTESFITFFESLGSSISIAIAKKEAQDALIESQLKYSATIEQSSEGITIADFDGQYIMVNPAFCNMTGYYEEELLEMNVKDLIPHGTPLKLFSQIVKNNKSSSAETKLVRKDGTIFDAYIIGTTMTIGNKQFVQGIHRDITEAKQIEIAKQKAVDKLRTLQKAIDQSPVITVITDVNGTIEYVNPKFTQITGYTLNEAIGQNPRILKSDHTSQFEYKVLWETILSGNSWNGVFRNKKKNGELYWESAVISPVINEKGVITNFLAVKEDITERIYNEEILKTAKETAEAATASKSMFLATMSHEIRTPLNGLIGFSEILKKTNLTETQDKYVKNINRSALALLSLINDVLDFSKIEAGNLELHPEKVDIVELSKNVMEMFEFRMMDKGVEPVLTIAPTVPTYLHVDPTRVRQVLINLLGNATKFTSKGKIALKIEAESIEENDAEMNVTFSVSDTGIGIPKDKHDIIFKSYQQADGSTTKNYGGTGLGLTISAQLVEKMGSHIQLKSENGEGSCFYFTVTLPFEQGEHTNDEFDSQQATVAFDKTIINKATATILIVDDNEMNLLLLNELVQVNLPKTKIITTLKGEEACELYVKHVPDLILMDIQMPLVNGFEATRLIRIKEKTSQKRVPIVAITAGTTIYEKQKCLDADMDDYLAKPVKESELLAAIQKHLFEKTPVKPTKIEPMIIEKKEVSNIHFNRTQMLEKYSGDEKFVDKMLDIAFKTVPAYLHDLQNAINGKDVSQIKFNAHSLKGMGCGIAFGVITDFAIQIESVAETDIASCKKLLKEMQKEFEFLKQTYQKNGV